MPNLLKASGSSFYNDKIHKGKNDKGGLACCTYIVKEGGESIAIDREVAVKRALQHMSHV